VKARSLGVLAHDLLAVAIAWAVAFWLRFNLEIPADFQAVLWSRLPWVLLVYAIVFFAMGLYRGIWRYASLPDLRRILVAVAICALAVPALFALLRVDYSIPRTVYLIMPVLLLLIMGGSRLAYRAWKEGQLGAVIAKPDATPVLVIGAGAAGAALLKDLAGRREWRALGLVDDDPKKRGGEIFGVKVLGSLDEIAPIAARLGVTQAILAMPGATHGARQRALDLCAKAGVSVMTVPALADIVSGRVSVSALRAIELDDLLGRDPVALDEAGLQSFIGGKTVLVTGAGGSIGAELCRQIARFGPGRIVVLDNAEFALYAIAQEFADQRPEIKIAALAGDAKDERRVTEVFLRYAPQVVFHAAAYKHVPLMEGDNAFEAVANNVLSTVVVARAAAAHGAEKFVLISTDKAVNPTSVMGASKRLAELTCNALQAESRTPLVVVRFGNVIGSNGSVVPRFREQIARGGPITVTHEDMQRYFMSIPEAAQLVLQAGMMGKGGEIYVLDMGEPVKIVDLARQMVRLSGLDEKEVRIAFTGLRPGEKLHEEPLAAAEELLPTPHPRLRIARASVAQDQPPDVRQVLGWLTPATETGDEAVRARLRGWIAGYRG
jgi:FlaA1/EpsC-like NDP-sugar epimerase